jgi:hypothetical protein
MTAMMTKRVAGRLKACKEVRMVGCGIQAKAILHPWAAPPVTGCCQLLHGTFSACGVQTGFSLPQQRRKHHSDSTH